jgi:DNA polymerase-1
MDGAQEDAAQTVTSQGPGAYAAGALVEAGVSRGDPVGLAVAPGVAVGLAALGRWWSWPGTDREQVAALAAVEEQLRPRWVVWSNEGPALLAAGGLRLATCWDVSAVHRLAGGGWQADPACIWAHHRSLPLSSIPQVATFDLFNHHVDGGDPEEPCTPEGHLRPEWTAGGWSDGRERVARWAAVALEVANGQRDRLATGPAGPRSLATARAESAAELLAAELALDGLPMDREVAEAILAGVVGPRPHSAGEVARAQAERDAVLMHHAPTGVALDVRSPGQVRAALARIGLDLPDTRAWRLRDHRDTHPFVDALLTWRKAERVATTYGYTWLDETLGTDGRLRGRWSGTDGAAGRMTASAGLHNLPREMRPAVVAEAGHVFVRADLGQIEPRVLAIVSADAALARASQADDMYAPVATRLGVDRDTAKVAVLGAMYGQTTGHGATALRGLKAAYPVAMAFLDEADRAARAGQDLQTYGGRTIPMTQAAEGAGESFARLAARGRYGRNAVIQGAAAELFKRWAVTVRARGRSFGAVIVLCLHDELLLHVPVDSAPAAVELLGRSLAEAAAGWAPDGSVRFTAEISVVARWSDAKDPAPGRDPGPAGDPGPAARR